MALISKLQKHSYIVGAIVGFSLIAFLFMDLNSNFGLISQGMNNIGKVNGNSISAEDFDKKYKTLEDQILGMRNGKPLNEQEQQEIKNQLWNDFVNENTIKKSLKSLGIEVSKKEIVELTQGDNVDNNIKSLPNFLNKNGQFDPNLVKTYIKSLSVDEPNTLPGSKRKQWKEFEKNISNNRLIKKVSNIISNSLYMPKWLNDFETNLYTNTSKINYVYVPYSSINDNTIKFTDDDLKNYYEKNTKKFYNHQPNAAIKYAMFPLNPTVNDSIELMNGFNEKISLMKSSTNDTNFMRSYAENGYDSKFYSLEDLQQFSNAQELLNSPLGSVVGPFRNKNKIQAIKIINKKNISDSVFVREIKIDFTDIASNQTLVQSRLKKVDSIFKDLDTLNLDFNQIAIAKSMDKGQDQGRWIYRQDPSLPREIFDLGGTRKYFKVMPSNDAIVRIVKVEIFPANIPSIQIGELATLYSPSESTRNNIYNQASNFKLLVKDSKSFETLKAKYPQAFINSTFIEKSMQKIENIDGNARELIKWGFNSKLNEVSNIISIGDNLIVAINNGIRSKDDITFDMVKDDVKKMYLYENKAKNLSEKLNKSNDLNSVASQFNTVVSLKDSLSFLNSNLGTSNEPTLSVISNILKPNEVSKAIKGISGVYKIQKLPSTSTPLSPSDMLNFKTQITNQFKDTESILQGIIFNSNIQDNRINYF